MSQPLYCLLSLVLVVAPPPLLLLSSPFLLMARSKDNAPKWIHFIGGGTGGCMGALLTCPLEVVKTQFQARHNRHALMTAKPANTSSFIFALKDIIQRDGYRGFWKGLVPNLVGVFPSRAIYFGVYNTTKTKILGSGWKESPMVHLLAAIAAGISVSTATSPIWLVKTRMQLQTHSAGVELYKNSWDCVRRVFKEEGFRGFYKGLGASYLGVAESSIQFVLYEKLKSLVVASKKEQGILDPSISDGGLMMLAGSAKLIAALCTYPHEVLRTRMREQRGLVPGSLPKYTGLWQAFTLIFKEEGVAGLYGGMGTHLLRVVPNAAIMFWTYELVVKYLSLRTKEPMQVIPS